MVAKLYLFGPFSHQATEEGWTIIWKVMVWSLFWLSQRVWPKVDHEGEPYGDDRPAERDRAGCPVAVCFRAILYGLKADLDHFARNYGLRHYGSNEMCEFCGASRVGDLSMRYNNFGADAVWPGKQYSEVEWRDLYKDRFLHHLFTLPGVSHFMVEPDELHVICLGVDPYFIGSILYLFVFPPTQIANAHARMEDIVVSPPTAAQRQHIRCMAMEKAGVDQDSEIYF